MESIPQKPAKWRKDNNGDYINEFTNPKTNGLIRGRIICCHTNIGARKQFGYRTENRWLLLINDFNYGCWKTLRRAKEQFTINFG
jgi:hypothetical protein